MIIAKAIHMNPYHPRAQSFVCTQEVRILTSARKTYKPITYCNTKRCYCLVQTSAQTQFYTLHLSRSMAIHTLHKGYRHATQRL